MRVLRRIVEGLASCIAVAGTLACDSLVGSYTVEVDAGAQALDTSRLCDIERREYAFSLDLDSDAQLDDLPSYYEAASPELTESFADLRDAYEAGDASLGATYMMGAAGVGKSFATRNLDVFEDALRCDIELTELFVPETDELPFETSLQDDLTTSDGKQVFNQLPGISTLADFDLMGMLDAAGCVTDGALPPLVVIDGVDEVVDSTASELLEGIDKSLIGADFEGVTFLHFLLVGRPEGFASWLTDPGWDERNAALVERFALNPPEYDTRGALDLRLSGYLQFSQDNFDELVETGKYMEYLDRFLTAVGEHPFLTYTLGNLAFGNYVMDHTALDTLTGEEEIKVAIFDDLIVRNAETHGRPGLGGNLDGPYRRALEDIAARYLEVSDDGAFTVRSDDTVSVFDDDGNELGEVRVRNLLNRSGVATLKSVTETTTRYRFDPFWVHAHLVERRNKRLVAGYEYHTCN